MSNQLNVPRLQPAGAPHNKLKVHKPPSPLATPVDDPARSLPAKKENKPLTVVAKPACKSEGPRTYKGCVKISDYSLAVKIGEGTFGEVSRGTRLRTSTSVALKRIIIHNPKEGVRPCC